MRKGRWIGMGAVLAAAGGVALLRYAIHGRSAQIFGRSVYRGPGLRKSIALTFDDGPSEATPQLLALLAREGIRATFFMCGLNALRLPEVVKQVQAAGHEIGNHTFTHARLPPRLGWKLNLRSPENIYNELASTQRVLEDLTGVRPRFFRAPYGMRWWGLGAAQRRLGLSGVHWTVIGHDWEWSSEHIADHVLNSAAPGGILCLHDGRDIRPEVNIASMLAALQRIIKSLRKQGYRFDTVSEILIRSS
ncbi:MAG: polysaccharide deacetylase family protein [Janthinobacterium lividum]